ncbi:MAG: PIN domain-containing protein, partial [Acidobacteria bacterium]|nr:PIN domain-containing protein [Acidobacteriota bacterium]
IPAQAPLANEMLLLTLQALRPFQIVVFDTVSAAAMTQLLARHQSRKRYADLMIAAMALAGRHIVVTRNQKDFADLLPRAQLQNWIDDQP